MITIDEITKLAELARIKLTDCEKAELQKDFEVILDYFKDLQALELNENENEEIFFMSPKINELRNDEEVNNPGEFSDRLLEQSPNKENGYIKVKKIL